jgi:hypothetical protein
MNRNELYIQKTDMLNELESLNAEVVKVAAVKTGILAGIIAGDTNDREFEKARVALLAVTSRRDGVVEILAGIDAQLSSDSSGEAFKRIGKIAIDLYAELDTNGEDCIVHQKNQLFEIVNLCMGR